MRPGSVITKGNDFSEKNSRFNFLLQHYKKGNVLDIGNIGGLYGGEGVIFSSYLKFVNEAVESTVHGFDLYAPKADADKYKNQKIGNIEDGLPYGDEYFDTVYLGELIEHLHNPGKVLKEIRRILKSDGVFILDTPNAYSTNKIIRWVLKREENLGDPTHVIIFTPGSLISLLEKNGFSIAVLGEKRTGLLSVLLGKGTGSHLLVKAAKNISL